LIALSRNAISTGALQWMGDPHLLERRYPRKPNRIDGFQECILRLGRSCRPTPPSHPWPQDQPRTTIHLRRADVADDRVSASGSSGFGLGRMGGSGIGRERRGGEDGLRPCGIETGTRDYEHSRGASGRSLAAENLERSKPSARLGDDSRQRCRPVDASAGRWRRGSPLSPGPGTRPYSGPQPMKSEEPSA
jgi:hypothetical protein